MHFKNLSQKIAKMSALTVAGIIAGVMFTPTDTFGALPKKKLEIIIGGDNFCKDNKDCAGDSFCNMTSHICIICPKPFEWVGGTQCVCPSGTVPNADNTDCVECMTDSNCQDLKGNLHWVCDTGTNTCACMTGLHEVGGECVCDNPNKTPDEDGNCICQLSQSDCPTSDFTGTNDCKCCPSETPKWDGLECRTCADVDRTKPYYNPDTKTCEECLTDEDCENEEVCSADKTCVCEMTGTECTSSDFNAAACMCCPAETPVYDAATGTCKTCEEMHPEWAESGATYDTATKQCWPYCGEQNVGLVMLVDRSGSTSNNCKVTRTLADGTKQKLYCEDLITEALQSLEIPKKMKTALYLHNTSTSGALNNPLPYGNHDETAINDAIINYTLTSGSVTTFKQALNDIATNICPTGDKLIIMMWTDGELDYTETPLKNMKNVCTNAKFYYVGPSSSTYSKYRDGYYAIKSLPEDYVDSLNDHMKQEGCVPRPEKEARE